MPRSTNYFPTKEAIIHAYYEEHLDLSAQRLASIPDFNEFSLGEKLQAFFETQFELFLPDREFVDLSIKAITFSFSQDYPYLKPIRKRFFGIMSGMFEPAIESGEIPDQLFLELTYQFLWDYYVGMIFYWLKDRSHQFENTTILIDKSLDLGMAFVRSNVMNKAFDMASFLFRHHVINHLDLIRDRVETMNRFKTSFHGEA